MGIGRHIVAFGAPFRQRPTLGDQQPGFRPIQVERVTRLVGTQIDPVNSLRELLDQPDAHLSLHWPQQVARRPGTRNATGVPVPNTPVRFKVPANCKRCAATGTVTAETTITRGLVRVCWCCRACGHEWPITRGEQQSIARRRQRSNSARRPDTADDYCAS